MEVHDIDDNRKVELDIVLYGKLESSLAVSEELTILAEFSDLIYRTRVVVFMSCSLLVLRSSEESQLMGVRICDAIAVFLLP